jgi:protease I
MKVYMIIAQKDFRDEELLIPKEILESKGFQTIIASPDAGICKGMLGAEVTADIKISEIDINSETKAIILIGGSNSPSLMKIDELGKKLELAKEKEIIIGAICLAPMVLAHFDIITGMSATVYPTPESLKLLKDHKILYIPEYVVVEDWLVTANGPQSASAFGEALVHILEKEK